jgi:hypothetical protein
MLKLALGLLWVVQTLYSIMEKQKIITDEQRRAYIQTLQTCAAAAQLKEKVVKDVSKLDEKQVDAQLGADYRSE